MHQTVPRPSAAGSSNHPLYACAALGFLRLPPTEPELLLLHRWLDTWTGVGLLTVGVERHGLRLTLSHIAEGEWRCVFMGDNPRLAPDGYGVAPTPWLLGIYNHAIIAGMTAQWRETEGAILVSFRPRSP